MNDRQKHLRKLDQKFYGTIIKAKDDTIVDGSEYCVFLAKDNAFAKVLPLYLEECIRLDADEEQISAVISLIERVDKWRAANPDRCKTPDAAGDRLLIP
jgi:hypothetical protein